MENTLSKSDRNNKNHSSLLKKPVLRRYRPKIESALATKDSRTSVIQSVFVFVFQIRNMESWAS
jgi:hypothetical protein